MLRRIVSLVVCVCAVLAVLPLSFFAVGGGETVAIFDDRILYGGYAVDVGGDTVFSENGALFRRSQDGETFKLAELDAAYINYYDGLLWFVSGNDILCGSPDGSEFDIVYSFDSEIKCLYVTENGIMYLKGDSVYRKDNAFGETLLLTRDGIEGFVPLPDGKIRWAERNPDYSYISESGDEMFADGNELYNQYIATVGSEREDDIAAGEEEYGVSLAAASGDYSGPYVQVGNITLPLENHMPGTYFSKNGQACTCHNTSSTYCIQSVGNCNCMRYYPTGQKSTCEVDLLGAQCFAFARMIFWKCFGFIDHSMNESLYYSVGSLSSGAVTANSVKALLMKAAPGAHVRLAAGHSVSILTMDEDFIVIYHGNAGGDGVVSSPCVVSTRRYTWEQFASACSRGILYVNMPYNYPDSEVILTKKEVGFYKLKANLNLRAEANTASESLSILSNGSIIEITEVDGFWGKTDYYGTVGWVFLEYTTFFSRAEIISSSGSVRLDDDGYLHVTEWKLNFDSFAEHFDKQSITLVSPEGEELGQTARVTTGCEVRLAVNGKLIDSAKVCIAGDINCNGVLDVGDFIMAKRAYMGTLKLSELQTVACDVSGNGRIDTLDYLLIKRFFFNPNPEYFSEF